MSNGRMLTCANCGNEEPEGSRFCGNCGAVFVPADQEAVQADTSSEKLVTCASCGNEEPEGSRFCGSCSAPLVPSEAALAPEPPSPQPAVAEPPGFEPPPSPSGGKRLRWVAAGALVVALAAGGAVAALLLRTDGADPTQATPTTQSGTISETVPPPSGPTLAESIAPRFQALAASQTALSARVRSLRAGTESFAALHKAAASLVASVVQAQGVVEGLSPGDATEAETLALLRGALASHLAYAEAISSFPPLPRELTNAQARAAIDLAGEAEVAYAKLAFADPTLPSLFISGFGNARLLEVVPSSKPAAPATARRAIDLAPLLVGIGPNDPPSEGRCFGPYTSRASLRVSGVTYRSGFIQCGDDANGNPSRASGVYRFSGPTPPAGSRLARVTARAAIDESSSPSQRGSSVTWTVLYDGAPICSVSAFWSGSHPSPRELDCRISPSVSAAGFDVRRLRIQQVASLASSGSFWAGLLDPRIAVEVPG